MALRRDPSLIPLSHDHHHGLVRVFQIRQALRTGDGAADQVTITRAFASDDLGPHFRAEEQALFPVLERFLGGDDGTVRRLLDDHRTLLGLIRRLDESPHSLQAFADLLEKHIRFEERDVFPRYQAAVPPELRMRIEKEIRRILDRPDDRPKACDLPPKAARNESS